MATTHVIIRKKEKLRKLEEIIIITLCQGCPAEVTSFTLDLLLSVHLFIQFLKPSGAHRQNMKIWSGQGGAQKFERSSVHYSQNPIDNTQTFKSQKKGQK